MRFRSILFVLILVALAALGFYFRADLGAWLAGAGTKITDGIAQEMDQLAEIKKEILTPAPLRGPIEPATSFLTAGGTLVETNRERAANGGLPALAFNAQLAAAAQAKVDDMFARQYFEHESPSGEGPGDLADAAGYEYLLVGENLALGNFKDDAALVQAWMDSPGHRANILNDKYSEIGVAVGRGTYEGRSVWLAVQEFGRPLSDCPEPDEALGDQIDASLAQLAEMEAELEQKRQEVEATRPKRGAEYNRKAEEYNELVDEYNKLIDLMKSLIKTYNAQVEKFNACI